MWVAEEYASPVRRVPATWGILEMLVNEQFRRCATFLFVEGADPETGEQGLQPRATAFFVNAPVTETARRCYVVTARHVAAAAKAERLTLNVRVNRPDGKFKDVPIPAEAWVEHPTSDVAAAILAAPGDWLVFPIPVEMMITPAFAARSGLGIGDEIFFVGLYSERPGREAVQPVVRFGHIARMPTEKLTVSVGPETKSQPLDAYLVEARSWGGQSGSPAFVYFSPNRVPGAIVFTQATTMQFALLGLVHGHDDINRAVVVEKAKTKATVPINSGMAIVIPAADIIDVINSEEFKLDREEQRKRLESDEKMPTADMLDALDVGITSCQ